MTECLKSLYVVRARILGAWTVPSGRPSDRQIGCDRSSARGVAEQDEVDEEGEVRKRRRVRRTRMTRRRRRWRIMGMRGRRGDGRRMKDA